MIEIDNRDWVTASIGRETYKTTLETSLHTVISDEPLDLGGKDLGPAPGDLLRMSLASCTAITLRMYANRKKIDVENIKVTAWSERLEEKTVFHLTVALDGILDDSQRKRMAQIAKMCPIHKVLTGTIEVDVQMS